MLPTEPAPSAKKPPLVDARFYAPSHGGLHRCRTARSMSPTMEAIAAVALGGPPPPPKGLPPLHPTNEAQTHHRGGRRCRRMQQGASPLRAPSDPPSYNLDLTIMAVGPPPIVGKDAASAMVPTELLLG